MDVVEPWSGKKSVLEKDGTIHSAGDTVLGADDIPRRAYSGGRKGSSEKVYS